MSSEGKRWTLVRREAEPGRKAGPWRVDYDSERLWGFEYEVVVPASEVERLRRVLRQIRDYPHTDGHLHDLLTGVLNIARNALHPDEPKEE